MSRPSASLWRKYRLLVLAVVAVFLIRHWLNSVQFNPANDTFDAELFFAFSVVVTISALIMLWDTPEWTVRAVGVLGLLIFSGALYGLTTQYAIWQWHKPTAGDLNWIRAVALLAAPLLLISQVRYIGGRVLGRIRDRQTARNADEMDGMVEDAHAAGVQQGQIQAADAMNVPVVSAPVLVTPPEQGKESA